MDANAEAVRFICLEGPDGAGKSVSAAALVTSLRAAGWRVTAAREPGGTHLGELVRSVLLDTRAVERTPESDALLFSAARGQLVRDVIRPALARGEVVVCDRFAPSTIAYQGFGSGLDREALAGLERLATGGLQPDLIVLLDVPVEVGLRRRSAGDPAARNRFEDETLHDAAFHARVRDGYLAMAAADPGRWRIIDGDRAQDAVTADVLAAVLDFLATNEPIGARTRIRR